ncbi:MAG: hypothetical protein KDH20_17610 [Rhodocyclaceae bacterium]|nr:hypothetical protein [Rhodocyclaceae bacterium]
MDMKLQPTPLRDVTRIVFEYVSHRAPMSALEQEEEIDRMIELNGLVAFDPDMFDLAA